MRILFFEAVNDAGVRQIISPEGIDRDKLHVIAGSNTFAIRSLWSEMLAALVYRDGASPWGTSEYTLVYTLDEGQLSPSVETTVVMCTKKGHGHEVAFSVHEGVPMAQHRPSIGDHWVGFLSNYQKKIDMPLEATKPKVAVISSGIEQPFADICDLSVSDTNAGLAYAAILLADALENYPPPVNHTDKKRETAGIDVALRVCVPRTGVFIDIWEASTTEMMSFLSYHGIRTSTALEIFHALEEHEATTEIVAAQHIMPFHSSPPALHLSRMALARMLSKGGDGDWLIIMNEPASMDGATNRTIVQKLVSGGHRKNQVICGTQSPILLTDVCGTNITMVNHDGVTRPATQTFGDSISSVSLYQFGTDFTGQYALQVLDGLLEIEWTKKDIPLLRWYVSVTASGYHRAELRSVLNKLEAM